MTSAPRLSLPRLIAGLLLVLLLGVPALALPGRAEASLLHMEGPVPEDLGVHGGSLSPCGAPAHCARVDWPLADPEAALGALVPILETTEGLRILERDGAYLHATATSRLFGFVDDLELYAPPASGVLQARSSSRLGDSDLGVNGRRLAALRQELPGS
ncbi:MULTISPECIES: DUF1499 domain-containing protein [Cyanophyceae]|jgi:uncharacterized protein (DUF1499 family)|uniref:DUF1499 domain-containing protein n=1 Tax=Aphanothece cf. minutissima CCALA 015 TaxID=2107695 RepID=A0ABX5F9R8_9CHRO|nr:MULTISPECIES: DUF1499 domain-containing protein [Cyanophyceae]MCP9932664.1 DUF1499 domain-containing protein [Cyanobium sp. Candia 9D4]PSB37183.1 DUF1499 domain-containing protein [Aphanothece cf. minutissima CCALA 015]